MRLHKMLHIRKERKRGEIKKKMQQMVMNTVAINPNIQLSNLNVNGPNTPMERRRLSECIKKI